MAMRGIKTIQTKRIIPTRFVVIYSFVAKSSNPLLLRIRISVSVFNDIKGILKSAATIKDAMIKYNV